MLRNKKQGQGKCQQDQADPIPIFERLLSTASTNELQQPTRRAAEFAIGHGKEERNRQPDQGNQIVAIPADFTT